MRNKQISSENRTPDILPGTVCGEVLKKDVILRDLSCQGELYNGGVAAVILMMDNVFSFQSLSCKITHEPYSRNNSLQFARVDNDEKLSGPLKLDIRSCSLYIIIIIIKYKQIPIHFYDQ